MIVSIDVETSISNKGNPFDTTNSLVSVAWTDGTVEQCVGGTYDSDVQTAISNSELLVGFNIKFDLHWLRRAGYNLANIKVWDCQVAEFILSRQKTKYPSLDGCLATYGLEAKLDIVKTEYWEKGIDTKDIPWDILSAYNIQDVKQTLELYRKQLEIATPKQIRLIQLSCMDLLTLEEMEYNGVPVDLEECANQSAKIKEQINIITDNLGSRYPHIPINFNSTDHLSAYLYGGTIEEEKREVAGLYKTGSKIGQPRFKVVRETHTLEGLVKPIEGSELKKEGLYSTSEDVLKRLKDKTGTIPKLLELARLTKINEFFEGFIKINNDMNWPRNRIHGQFNQVTTATGRLSSTKPNLQNMCPEIQTYVRSEY
jgi:DNA polymerase I-like protein with 3'-5' exonuclease and polymerase domains